jgi:hypothetical protein
VIHDADPIRQVEDVVDVVADEEDPEPLVLQLLDEVAHLGRLGGAERGGRLVHDHDPCVEVHGARDGHGLALPAGERDHGLLEALEVGVQPAHHLPRLVLHRTVVERAPEVRHLAAQEHVGRRIDVVGERELLVDALDVEVLGVARVADDPGLAVHQDLARVGGMRSGERADQRRLACAVAADEAQHLPRIDVDAHVIHRVDAAERHPDVAHLDERHARFGGHRRTLHYLPPPRRRLYVSSPTATIRTMPATTFWVGEFTPLKLNP